tara:strand:+ start:4645 stop:5175 length:531 start_codon:yes stop_codon:yes gene_type:complete
MFFEIDIAFTSAPRHLLNLDLNENTIDLLNNSEQWKLNFDNWINFLCIEYKQYCPELMIGRSSFSLGLAFVDDFKIVELNQKWRGISKSTDVLSFPAIDNSLNLPLDIPLELGDIFVSVPKAQIQAIEHSHCLAKELNWLVTHGLLHLLGWDHPDAKLLKEMLYCQDRLMELHVET